MVSMWQRLQRWHRRWMSRPRDWRGRLRHVRQFDLLSAERLTEIRADAGLPFVLSGEPAAEPILQLFDAVGLQRPSLESVLSADDFNEIIDRINRSRAAA